VVTAAVMWLGYNQNVVGLVRDNLAPWLGNAEKEIDWAEMYQNQQERDTYFQSIDAEIVEFDTEGYYAGEAPKAEIEYRDPAHTSDSEVYFGIGYILGNIPQTVKLLLNTAQEITDLYIRQIFGGIFGEAIVSPVKLSWLYVFAVISIVFMTTLLPQGEPPQYRDAVKWWGLAVALAVVMLVVVAGIMWTPVNYVIIYGIQGRYIIPVLPLIVLFFTNGNITTKKKIDGALLFALCAVNVLMLLDGLSIMLANTTVYY